MVHSKNSLKLQTLVKFALIGLALTACQRSIDFSSNDQQKLSPGVQCVPSALNLVVPADVEVNQPFNVSVNLSNAVWSFQNGTSVVSAQGSPASVTLSPIGSYSGTVSGNDECGGTTQKTFSVDVVNLPITNLSLIINGGATYTKSVNVSLTIAATGATQMYITNDSTCQSGGTWQPYAASQAWVLGQQNQLTHVYVEFKNNDYIDNHCVSAQITEDDIAPALQFVSTPPALTNSRTGAFQVSVTDNLSGVANIFCKLDSGSASVCQSQFSFSNLVDGQHTVSVYAVDNAGNQSQPISYSWNVDNVAPVVTITQQPANPSVVHNADFAFTVTDTIAIKSTQCAVDGAVLADCVSPTSYTLPNGNHTFVVKATDVAGNSGSASYTWVINDKITTQDIPVTNANGKADILFVLNNSSTMYSELSDSIPDRFTKFLSQLGNTDYHISYITADASGAFPNISHGKLLPLLAEPTPWDRGTPEMPISNVLTSASPDLNQSFIATMIRPEVICLNVGSGECIQEGSGYQEGIHSTLLALQNYSAQFVRQDAALNVVIISDKDEGNGYLTNSSGVISAKAPSYNQPQTLVNYVKQTWPTKVFTAHAIVQRPTDNDCNDANYNTNKSYIYNQLVQMTGGASADICNEYDKTQIQSIAQAIQKSSIVTYQLKCVPQPGTVTATYTPQPASPISIIVNGSTVNFNPSPAPGTVVHLQYVCP